MRRINRGSLQNDLFFVNKNNGRPGARLFLRMAASVCVYFYFFQFRFF